MPAGAPQNKPVTPDTPGLTSSRGRLVKPKVWDDGTEAVPATKPSAKEKDRERDKEKEMERDRERETEAAGSESSHELAQHSKAERAKWRPNYANSLAKRGSVPIRDETGRFIGVRPKTAAERLQRQPLGSGGIFKSAAVEVLRLERRLMSTGDIAKVALQRGLIKCQGKTPEATMASALYTDVKRKEGHSIFIRPHEGLFGLREWADKGLVFKVMEDDEHYVDDPNNPQYHHHGGEYAYQGGNSGGDFEGEGFQGEHEGYEASDGDIYGSEGQYIRYEEGAWDSPEAYEEVSSGHPYANPRGRSGSARPSHSYGVDRVSDEDMDEGDAYVTPETTAPLQAADQDAAQDAVSGGRPGSAARSRSGGRARSGGHQADSRMSPATDEENSNIMLLLDAAEELHKTASHDGPEPSTAATHGAITSADPTGAHKDDAAYPPSKHARLAKDQLSHGINPKAGAKMTTRGGSAGRGGSRHGTRGKAKMLADESRFSRPHPLQPPNAAKRDPYPQGPDPSASRGGAPEDPPVLPHHASFPETAAELVLDLTVEGHNATSSSNAYTGFGDRPAMAGPDQVNILNLPLPDFDTLSGTSANYPEERPEDMDPSEPDGITSAPTPKPPQAPNSGPPGAVTRGRLQSLEQNLLVLERNYGATHPQVGKAWLLLSKIYQSNPASASQVMAEAALVRSWEVYALCQGAAQPEDLTPATVQSFSHLLEKIQRNPEKMAQVQVAQPQVHVVNAHHKRQLQQQHQQRLLQQQQQQLQLQQLQQLRQQQLQQQQQAQRQQAVGQQAYTAQMAQPQQAAARPQGSYTPHAQGGAPLYTAHHWPGGYVPAAAAQHSQAPVSSQHAALQQQVNGQRQQLGMQQQQQQQLLHGGAASVQGLSQQQQRQQSAAASMPALTQQQKFMPQSNPVSGIGLSQQPQQQQQVLQNSAPFHGLPQQQQQQLSQQLPQSVAGSMQALLSPHPQQGKAPQQSQQHQQPMAGAQSSATATQAEHPQ
ncbi:hypothetical protein ABBQ38_007832 [Trebouxia sp. C0009 RCD-2024]